MKSENLYTMKQPELGKRILELRKQKGFTQEELVEQCNINVRTIQRIEAGDVTPRSFTIKTILEVLGVDNNSFFQDSIHEKEVIQFTDNDKKILTTSLISGIFVAVFSVIGMIIEFSLLSEISYSDGLIPRVLWSIPFLGFLFFFLRGYRKLGLLFHNTTLVSATYVYFICEFVIVSITVGFSLLDFEVLGGEVIWSIVIAFLFGASEIILGIGVMRLKEYLGSFANTVGILKIINGGMLVTIIFAPFGGLLVIPVLIIEVILIYNTVQKFSDDGMVRS